MHNLNITNTDMAGEKVQTKDPIISSFLKSYFKTEDYSVFPLAGDASNRRYYRVVQDNHSWVLMQWEPFDSSDVNKYPFLSVLTHFAKHKVQVPEVIHLSSKDGLVLLEDLGDLTLERKFWETQNQEASIPFYKLAMDELLKIHFQTTKEKNECTAFKMRFDKEKLLWEMNYGRDNLLKGLLNLKLEDRVWNELQDIFESICGILDREPQHIQHRDYHSRNLMIKFNKMRVIDFQDARLGAIQYDLVSLLKDSYVNLSDENSHVLLNYYLDIAKDQYGLKVNPEHFNYIYEIQSIQRCFKACGSFSSFFVQRNDKRYLKYISGTLKRVLKSLTLFPEYKAFSDILIDSGAIEKKYE